jgi:hypothetical protein
MISPLYFLAFGVFAVGLSFFYPLLFGSKKLPLPDGMYMQAFGDHGSGRVTIYGQGRPRYPSSATSTRSPRPAPTDSAFLSRSFVGRTDALV